MKKLFDFICPKCDVVWEDVFIDPEDEMLECDECKSELNIYLGVGERTKSREHFYKEYGKDKKK